ncbi:MAG: M24 family metallopeptidase, partial [Bacillota bacterium]|nr:M24 family metallopeptidase [Bacillota bacterium]
PVIMTLLPEPSMAARRRTILLLTRREDGTVERLTVSRYGMGDFYEAAWDPDKEEQWACLARLVRERNPKVIGINVSSTFAFGDGLTHAEYVEMTDALGPELAARTKGAERLAVGWLERRISEEIEAYTGIVEIARAIVAEAFSSKVILPGVTTTEDVVWWMRQKVCDLGLRSWFQPSVSIQAPGLAGRSPGGQGGGPARILIQPGDVLHCDFGLVYLGFCTDTQENAYVLKLGECEAPAGLSAAFATGNRLQDIHLEAMRTGRTGNEILAAALKRAVSEGIQPSVYTHPLGYHGHAAGPTIGLWDQQGGVPGRGDYELFDDTCHSIELNVRQAVPEWDGQQVRMALEQDVAFTGGKPHWLAGRQAELHLIK